MPDDAVRAKQEKATTLSLTGVLAMVIAYVMTFSVLTDTDMASKFENGDVPAGTDITGIQLSTVGSVIAAIVSVVLVTAGNIVHSNLLTNLALVLNYLAAALFTLLTLVTVGMAF